MLPAWFNSLKVGYAAYERLCSRCIFSHFMIICDIDVDVKVRKVPV